MGGICSILAGLTRWRAEKKPQFDHNPPFWTGFPLINMEMAKNQFCNTKNVFSCENFLQFDWLRACLHGGGGPQDGEVTRLGVVTGLSI